MKMHLLSLAVVVCYIGLGQAQLWQMGQVPFLYGQSPVPSQVRPTPIFPSLRGEFRMAALIESRFLTKDDWGDDKLERFQCAGTLINLQWVLTAAICVRQRGETAANATIWLGRWNLTANSESGSNTQVIPKENIFIHPWYGSSNPTYNFALLKLPRTIPTTMNATIWPVDLPDESMCSQDYTGTTFPVDSCTTVATTFGWGQESGSKSGVLVKTIVPTYYYDSCNSWRTGRVYTEATLCAGGLTYGDICVGDRGSALMCRDAKYDQWYLLGVAQYGDPNCMDKNTQSRLPGVYGRVCTALPFIRGTFIANRPTTTTTRRTTTRRTTTTTAAPVTEEVEETSNPPDGVVASLAPTTTEEPWATSAMP